MVEVVVERTVGAAKRAIVKGLVGYNDRTIGRKPWRTLAVTVRDAGEIRGGAIGEVWNGWLFVKYLWLADELRGKRFGCQALATLEEKAKALGAEHVYLDTFSFQAPAFYAKLGYREFGRLDGYPKGHSRLWLSKDL